MRESGRGVGLAGASRAAPSPSSRPGADVPHLSLPFRFATPYAAVCEQDSLDEIADCVLAILSCPIGFRVELPSFGITDQTFSTIVDTDELLEAIEAWEPRASATFDQYPGLFDQLIRHVTVALQLRTEE